MADRVDHLEKLKKRIPDSNEANIIIFDRYNLSYLAYQKQDTGKEFKWLFLTQEGLPFPDITVFVDVDPKTCIERIKLRQSRAEKFENFQLLTNIRNNYLELINNLRNIGQNIKVVDGNGSVEETHQAIISFF